MAWMIALIVVVVAGLLALAVWSWYASTGRAAGVTSLSADEFTDEVESCFVPDGWKLEHRARDFLIFQRGASGCTGLVLLVVFLPLGLVYLLTDWGRGKLVVSFRENDGRGTEFQFDWNNAAIRGHVRRLVDWLEEDAGA